MGRAILPLGIGKTTFGGHMPCLKSGRRVGVSFKPYLRLLKSAPTGQHYGTAIHFRLNIRNPTDLLPFASVVEYDRNEQKPFQTVVRSDFTISDLASGRLDWNPHEVEEFDYWISTTQNLGSWLKLSFDVAKKIADETPKVLSAPSPEELQRLKVHNALVDRLFATHPVMGFFHFTDERNLPIIRASRAIFCLDVIRAMNIPVAAFGGDAGSQASDKRNGMDKYVHLCMFNQNPMEYRARQDGRIRTSKFLEIDREVLRDRPGVMFTPGMSNKTGVTTMTVSEAIEQLDFNAVCNRMNLDDGNQLRRVLEARKYEVLIPHSIEERFIRNL